MNNQSRPNLKYVENAAICMLGVLGGRGIAWDKVIDLIVRTNILKGLSEEEITKIFETLREPQSREMAFDMTVRATEILPERIRESIYFNLSDIMLVDGELDEESRNIQVELADLLRVSKEISQKIVDVILIKRRRMW